MKQSDLGKSLDPNPHVLSLLDPDPNPLVSGMDPDQDPFITKQKCKKNLDSTAL